MVNFHLLARMLQRNERDLGPQIKAFRTVGKCQKGIATEGRSGLMPVNQQLTGG
jgi:hypothetical protein